MIDNGQTIWLTPLEAEAIEHRVRSLFTVSSDERSRLISDWPWSGAREVYLQPQVQADANSTAT